MRKYNLLQYLEDVFYDWVYPIYAKEFLTGTDYDLFVCLVSDVFLLNRLQWQFIEEHWLLKGGVLE